MLCVVEAIPETNFNVDFILDLLKTEEVCAVYTVDLKMANLMTGLSVGNDRKWKWKSNSSIVIYAGALGSSNIRAYNTIF